MTRPTAAFLVALAILSLARTAASAGDPPVEPTTASEAAAPEPAPPQAVTAPAHFDAEAATEAYMAQLSPEARAKSDAYFEGGYWLIGWNFLVAGLVAWVFLGTRLSARIRDWAERRTRMRWLQTALYGLVYLGVSGLMTLPWSAYEGYFREHQYGMSNEGLGTWLGDEAKELAIGLVLGAIAITAIYGVVRRLPRTWWLWGALVATGFLAFTAAIGPVFLKPLFNDFRPLAEGPLKEEILSMARANEIPATDVYEFDASKQTKRISANVSGMFGTTRISLNDNLMTRASAEEIKAVLGHEMGHYVLNHIYEMIVATGLFIVAGFAFLHASFEKVRNRFGASWGIRDIGDVAALPLLLFLFSTYELAITPLYNTMTRTIEVEADNYGLNAARQPDGFAQAALHLSEYRKMTPGPIEEFLFYDHPSGWNRIHRAMVWKAEHLADANVSSGTDP